MKMILAIVAALLAIAGNVPYLLDIIVIGATEIRLHDVCRGTRHDHTMPVR